MNCLGTLEVISRFLFRDDYDQQLNVKPKVFSPSKSQNAISVYRLGRLTIASCERLLSLEEGWRLADEMIPSRDHKGSIVARTDFSVGHVEKLDEGLSVVEDTKDHPRHAHIQPFPTLAESASEDEQNAYHKRRQTLRNKLVVGLKAQLRNSL